MVTGGGKGLGAAIAARLAAEGFKVAVLGRDRLALERVAREIGGLSVEADVTDDDAMRRALERVHETSGPISVLVQNAGISASAPLGETTDETWDRTLAVNVTAAFKLVRAVIPEMKQAKWGRVVHIAGASGLTGHPQAAAYCASKHALVGLTRALAAEFARTGITVNAVCPGSLDTEMTARTIEALASKTGRTLDAARTALEEQSPQHRLFRVDEVAHVVGMLCAEQARGVNGQAISVCGGQVMR